MESGLYDVEGAQLYYEKRGSGPTVLLISGAGGDAGYFSQLAETLSDGFTVINYDRRGNSRSTGRNDAPMTVEQHSDDAAALIRGLAEGQSLVFGNSGGAIVSLDLAARHPELLHGVIAHEPPVVHVLPEDDEWYGFFDTIGRRFQETDAAVAGGEFIRTIRGEGTYPWPDGLMERFMGNADYMFRWEWGAWGQWVPDFEALKNRSFPLILGAGMEDRGLYYARPSVEIAKRAQTPWVEFPGIHVEFLRNPNGFSAALRALLTLAYSEKVGISPDWT